MFGSVVLEVVLGLVFVYAWFSFACSAIVEFLESFRAQRGKQLAIAIERMLGAELTERFYQHGLVQSLSKAGRLPSYLPTRCFAKVTLDLLGVTSTQFRKHIHEMPGNVGVTLRALAKDAASYEHLTAQLEHWFDGTMERCTGWYRRRVRLAAFLSGLAVASLLNVDSLEIASALYSDTHLRLSVVTQAEVDGQVPIGRRTADKGPSVMSIPIESGTFPLGWENSRFASRAQWTDRSWSHPAFWFGPVLMKILGLMVTALAGSFGSAFWFEALKRLLTLRASLAVPAKNVLVSGSPPVLTTPAVALVQAHDAVTATASLAAAAPADGELVATASVQVPVTVPSEEWTLEHKPTTLIGLDDTRGVVEVDPIVNVDGRPRK